MKFPPRSLAIDIALDDDLIEEISQVAEPRTVPPGSHALHLGATPDERAVAQDTTAFPLGDARRGTIAQIISLPREFTLTCSCCERISETFDDENEMVDTLSREGWECGRPEFSDICPPCLDDIEEFDRVGRARFRR